MMKIEVHKIDVRLIENVTRAYMSLNEHMDILSNHMLGLLSLKVGSIVEDCQGNHYNVKGCIIAEGIILLRTHRIFSINTQSNISIFHQLEEVELVKPGKAWWRSEKYGE